MVVCEGILILFKGFIDEKKALKTLGHALKETHAFTVIRKQISMTSIGYHCLPPAFSFLERRFATSSFFLFHHTCF